MFLRSSTRPVAVDCFFCLSPSLLAPHPPTPDPKGKGKARLGPVGSRWNWQCDKCGCWNIRDGRGEMISDLPAMRSTSLNSKSFSLRARPSTSHLHSASPIPFCHNCLTNQTLIMNILANHLPDESDPSYPALEARLPEFVASLHARYPPVCSDCQPAVDECLRKADRLARDEAWGSALRRGATRSKSPKQRVGVLEVLVWRMRGVLWWASWAVALGMGLLKHYHIERLRDLRFHGVSAAQSVLAWSIVSIVWTAWDPWWLSRQRGVGKTRMVRGRRTWVGAMLLVMLLRIASAMVFLVPNWLPDRVASTTPFQASAILQVAVLVFALSRIRISSPVRLQLVQPVRLTPAATPTTPRSASQLALPSDSVSQVANPMFGQSSFHSLHPPSATHGAEDDQMDWEPSPSAALRNGGWTKRPPAWADPDAHAEDDVTGPEPRMDKADWNSFATNRQRFFPKAPEETGLENLLAGWRLGEGGAEQKKASASSGSGWWGGLW